MKLSREERKEMRKGGSKRGDKISEPYITSLRVIEDTVLQGSGDILDGVLHTGVASLLEVFLDGAYREDNLVRCK